MKLYDYYRSSSCYRLRIALNLKQVSYAKIPINLINQAGEQHFPSYHEINPQELVPTLKDNEHFLTQSLAIIEYLEELIPTPTLMPTTPLARAEVRSLALLIACDVHPLNNLRVLQQLREQFQATEDQVIAWYHQWLKKGFDAFETKLNQYHRKIPVCYGSHVTLADLCLIPQVYNADRYQFPMNAYPLINEINAYCLTLPAFFNARPEAIESE